MVNGAECSFEIWPDEYDTSFLKKLDNFLTHEIGAARENNEWGLGVSQKVSRFKYKIADHQIMVKTESYMGISICGPERVVTKIVEKLRNKMHSF